MNKDVFYSEQILRQKKGEKRVAKVRDILYVIYIEIRFGYSSHSPKKGVSPGMPGVLVRDDEPFERALKRFKKACEKAGVISDMKKNQHFEKPSERRKRKIAAARRKRIKLDQQYTR